jgi:lactoylglutathione lyase
VGTHSLQQISGDTRHAQDQQSPRYWIEPHRARGGRYRGGSGLLRRLFEFTLRGKSEHAAFIDLGASFLALQKGRKQPGDDGRHFGLVVDDKEAVRAALTAAGVNILPGRFLDLLDPWGNRIEIVGYDNIQFTKAPHVLLGMGLAHLAKTSQAIKELADKGMAPD